MLTLLDSLEELNILSRSQPRDPNVGSRVRAFIQALIPSMIFNTCFAGWLPEMER